MNYRDFEIFLEVCNTKNIIKAANNLYLAQPSVSYTIKKLETHFNVELFNRNPGSLKLTESGIKFMYYVSEILKEYKSINDIMNSKSENINLGVSIGIAEYYLPKYISKYKKTINPKEINVTIGNNEKIIKMVLNSELCFGIIDGNCYEKDIQAKPYYYDFYTAVVSLDHPLAKKDSTTFNEFVKYDLLLTEVGSNERDLFDSILKQHSIKKNPIYECSNNNIVISGIKENIGIGILPKTLFNKGEDLESIKLINISDINLHRKLSIVSLKGAVLSKEIKEFIEIIKSAHYGENS